MNAARYIENGNAKVAPCECSLRAIHEKRSARDDLNKPVWYCRNCGAESRRIVRIAGVVPGTGGRLKLDADGNLVAA